MKILKKSATHVFNPGERYTLSTDGSLRDLNSRHPTIGLGAELKDSAKNTVLFYSEELKANHLPVHITSNQYEELALLRALQACADLGVKKLLIKLDAQGLVSTLNSKTAKTPVAELLLYELSKFTETQIVWVKRANNTAADFYSRSTQKMSHDKFLHLVAKKPIEDIISREKMLKNRALSVVYVESKRQQELAVTLSDNLQNSRFELHAEGFRPLMARYTPENKELVLLFLTLNVATEKSSVGLLHKTPVGKPVEFVYKDDVWMSFSNVEYKNAHPLPKILRVTDQLLKSIRALPSFDYQVPVHVMKKIEAVAFNPKANYQMKCSMKLIKSCAPRCL